jgi:hypothetical protein
MNIGMMKNKKTIKSTPKKIDQAFMQNRKRSMNYTSWIK